MSDETTQQPPTAVEQAAADSIVNLVPWWAIHRRTYDWVLSFAHSKHSTAALFAISFAESSFFPIPPDVLLAPLCLSNRKKALWFATVTTVASVLGALLGYAIGMYGWLALRDFLFDYVPSFTPENEAKVRRAYEEYGTVVLFIAAFTPVPYKVFTVVGGAMGQALLPFIIVSLIGRGMRFYLVAAVFALLGPRAQPYIDKYFNLLCLLFGVLLVGGVVAIKLLH